MLIRQFLHVQVSVPVSKPVVCVKAKDYRLNKWFDTKTLSFFYTPMFLKRIV